MHQPVILAAKRTPVGKFGGSLARTSAPDLGAIAIKAVLEQVPAAKEHIDECIMGCVLQAGVGQNPARQAGLKAGLPHTLSAVTVNKVCGSGLQAVMQAATGIRAGVNKVVVAGGMENMDMAPTSRTCAPEPSSARSRCRTTWSTTACAALSSAGAWASQPSTSPPPAP